MTGHWSTPGEHHRLLIRRSLTRNAKGVDELAYFLCHTPDPAPLDVLVRVAGSRWAVEECFQAAKNEVGLDHYQVREYGAWYRHITLAMLAHTFLAVTARNQKGALQTLNNATHAVPPALVGKIDKNSLRSAAPVKG
jgi:SRSO17 transposase